MQRRKKLQNKLVECSILSVAARSGGIDAEMRLRQNKEQGKPAGKSLCV
jgi:hypothetical protein